MLSCCINAACLALLDASVSMKFLVAAVTCVVDLDGHVTLDPTAKQRSRSKASLTFAFESRSRGVLTSVTEGIVSQDKYQECLLAAKLASENIFNFYKETIKNKFSKEV